MQATDFEFRHRFWLIAGVCTAGFASYSIDHSSMAVTLARGSRTGVHLVLAAGALIIALAAALRTWASAYLRIEVVKDTALHSDRLVADGPYRHLRNPLYVGTVLLALGFGLLASRLGFLVITAGMALIVARLVGREEAALAGSQGAAYAAYRARVPAFWPALWPRVPDGSLEPAGARRSW